jgi:hypothetical protein
MARNGRGWMTLPENDRLLTVAQAAELLARPSAFRGGSSPSGVSGSSAWARTASEAMSAFLSPHCASSSPPVSSSR